AEVVQARQGSGFTSLQEVADVKYFRELVILPAAIELRDRWIDQHNAPSTSAPSSDLQATPAP
ncbi:MAG: hypothetical protein QGG40_18215, partial [Myxococcota bacterium]|nr:hypothetical protein [Myxococcota bacterium]